MTLLWLAFTACSLFIVVCGTNLSRYGDAIAEKTGLGRAWIGLILMAAVTSLPELITGISSVTLADAPDIALGDVMGSCVFNLSIIALMDMLYGRKPIFSACEHGHSLSAGFGLILISLASMSILINRFIPAVGQVGLYTPAIVIIYALGIRSVFLFQKKKMAKLAVEAAAPGRYFMMTVREAAAKYGLNAAIIVVAATLLPVIGDRLADETGLGQSFIGTIVIAFATSLPELVVSVAAVRIGAVDLAVANLFGSNMFNILIIAVDDLFYRSGPLLSRVSSDHAVTGFMSLIMTGIAVVSLTYRIEKKFFLRLGWDAAALILAYIGNIYLLFSLRGGR